MPRKHVVEEGDNVVALAEAAGFLDHRRVWDDPENAALRASGRSPTVLARGDEITVPDLHERSFTLGTGRNHTFVLAQTSLRLRLKLCSALSPDPLADAACELGVDGAVASGTNGEGIIEEKVRATTRTAELDCDGFADVLDVSSLEPVETDSGLVARLNNLGYYAGEVDDDIEERDPARLQLAIEELQLDQGLRRTGVPDAAFRAMLKAQHGC